MNTKTTACLLISCPDKPGIVSAVSSLLYNHGVNITALDQHSTDPEDGTFIMRLEFQTPHLDVSREVLERSFDNTVARRYGMKWCINYATQPKKVTIMVSRLDHGMLELLWRWSRGELAGEVTQVISNHPDLAKAVEIFGVPFHHVPVTAENKPEAEARILELMEGKADLVVLARYMQILSEGFVDQFPNRIINIHHSFLPAFIGADPYRRAYERGVKLIGATAHYVTTDLDEGPIIEQDVIRASHRHNVTELKEFGTNIERAVLARAVKWHLENRVIVHGNKTVVFV